MNKFIKTKQYKQFSEFCRACHRDQYIGLCYGSAGAGKTESARHYSKWYRVMSHFEDYHLSYKSPPTFSMKSLHSVVFTPSILETPRQFIRQIETLQRQFSLLKERYIYGEEIPMKARLENKNFAELVIIDEAERLKPQAFELIREMYDKEKSTFIFIGMPGIERILERFPQLYSRIGFVHKFKSLGKQEIEFLIEQHFKKFNLKIQKEDFTDQEAIAALIRITNGNFRLINRLVKQAERIMKVNCMTTLTKEVLEAARSCLLIGEK